MTLEVRINKNFKSFRKLIPDARSLAARAIRDEMENIILNELAKGTSPVKGFSPYKQYRPATAKKKGRKKPVDLFDTGALWDSFKTVIKRKDTIRLSFNKKYASFLQFGTENMDARPLLPTRGLRFKQSVINQIIKLVGKAVNTAEKRNK